MWHIFSSSKFILQFLKTNIPSSKTFWFQQTHKTFRLYLVVQSRLSDITLQLCRLYLLHQDDLQCRRSFCSRKLLRSKKCCLHHFPKNPDGRKKGMDCRYFVFRLLHLNHPSQIAFHNSRHAL